MVDSDHDGFVVNSGHIAGTTVQGKGVPAAGRGRYRQQNGDDENKEESFFPTVAEVFWTFVTLAYKRIYNLFLHYIQTK